MISFVVMVLIIGVLAGAIAREVGPDPHPLGDVGPWLFALVGSAVGAVVGLLLGGGDAEQNSDQAWALIGCLLGAAIAVAAFVALAFNHQRSVATNSTTRQRSTPVSGARDHETGASHGS